MNINNSIPSIFETVKTRSNILSLNDKNHFFDKNKLIINTSRSLSERISEINNHFGIAIEINARSDKTLSIIKKTKNIDEVVSSSLFKRETKSVLHIIAEEEFIPIQHNSTDLIYTVFGLDYINDLPGSLSQIHDALKKDGMFVAAFLGEGTLLPLADSFAIADEKILGGVHPRIHPFFEIKTLANLMHRLGFKDIVADQEKINKKYLNLKDLLFDIRSFGITNLMTERRKQFTPASVFKIIERNLKKQSSIKPYFFMPFNILFVSCWK